MKDEFQTTDFGLATTLSALGFSVKDLDKSKDPRRIRFVFEKTNELDEAIQKFWSNDVRIEPKEFCMQQKALKSQLYHMS